MRNTETKQRKVAPEPRPLQAGLWAVFIGVTGLLATFVVVVILWKDESGLAALTAVASSIAAILSGYFGYQRGRRRR